MSIKSILDLVAVKADLYELVIPGSWAQGRTAFGGITAALCYQAAENLIEDERAPRSFHCNFIGPVTCDEPIQVTAEVLRTGKNVTQIVAKVIQNDRVSVMTQICFGVKRESVLLKPNQASHNMQAPKRGKFIPQIPKLVPKFIQHFELALEKGSFAIGKSDDAILHGWSRLKNNHDDMTIARLIAIMDAWPPTMFQLMRLPVPASTMSWDVEFINSDLDFSSADWLASTNEATHIRDGYGHEESTFWTPDGQVLAYSRQVVTVFA